jgi:hypothetical protein
MTSRRLLTLSIIALVAVVAGVWLAGRQGSSASGTQAQLLYPELKTQLDSVNAIHIYKAGDARSVELLRKDGSWTVGERDGYPADGAKVRKLLIDIADAKLQEEKTSDPQQYATLGVEDTSSATASSVRIELVGPPKPANLIVGKQGTGARAHYVRRAGEPQSWLINTTVDTSSAPDAWLRKEIIDVAADRMQSATVTMKGAKSYTAAKAARADANFNVDGLPKGKALSSASVANSFSMALAGLTLADVRAASAFDATAAAGHTTFKTFDGLVVDADGWVQDQKHYLALRSSFDPAQAERFKVATTTPEQSKPGQPKPEQPKDAKQELPQPEPEPAKPDAPDVAEEASKAAAKLSGWVYEIPDYKYESIFKPLEQMLEK